MNKCDYVLYINPSEYVLEPRASVRTQPRGRAHTHTCIIRALGRGGGVMGRRPCAARMISPEDPRPVYIALQGARSRRAILVRAGGEICGETETAGRSRKLRRGIGRITRNQLDVARSRESSPAHISLSLHLHFTRCAASVDVSARAPTVSLSYALYLVSPFAFLHVHARPALFEFLRVIKHVSPRAADSMEFRSGWNVEAVK